MHLISRRSAIAYLEVVFKLLRLAHLSLVEVFTDEFVAGIRSYGEYLQTAVTDFFIRVIEFERSSGAGITIEHPFSCGIFCSSRVTGDGYIIVAGICGYPLRKYKRQT